MPGVVAGGASAGGTRLGGAGQNNIMMDGVSAMDTGNNGQMLHMNIEAIGEVKILTPGLPGRVRPLERPADHRRHQERHQPVPRVGLRRRRRNSDWNANSWVNQKNGDAEGEVSDARRWATRSAGRSASRAATTSCSSSTRTSIGRVTAAINSGNPIRIRVPTALERAGDFSQTRRQHRRAVQPDQGSELDAAVHGGEHGRLLPGRRRPRPDSGGSPVSDRPRVLSRYPLPNVTQAPGANYNYEVAAPTIENLTQQPAIRVDYQLSSKLRFTGKYSGQRARQADHAGHDSRDSTTS